MSTPSVANFFLKKKKTNGVIVENEDGSKRVHSTTEDFYKECLTAQKAKCNKQHCIEVISTLESNIKHVQLKNQDNKDAIKIARSIITQKDEEISALEKIIESWSCSIESSNMLPSSAESVSSSTIVERQKEVLNFVEYANYFTEHQLAELRSIGATKSEDSSFVSAALRSLYDGKLDTLQTKTVTGRSRTQKEKMTPEKVKIIDEMFQKRLQTSATDVNEWIVRKKRLNRLIKDAQNNITKSLKKKEEEAEIGRRLQ